MEGFNLSMDNVLDASELDLEKPVVEEPKQEQNEKPEGETGKNKTQEEEQIENIEAAEVLDAAHLELESVGGEKKSGSEGNPNNTEEVSSPTYSSIASAFKVDGVPLFSDADNEELEKLQSAEDFEEFINNKLEETITSRLGEAEKRIHDALNYGVEPSDIQLFENSLRNLNSISEEDITSESEEGENLRKQLIYTDLINKGFSEERAKKKMQQSFDANTDIEDAKDALEANKAFYQSEYDKVYAEKKASYDKAVEERKKNAEKLRKSILDDEKAFGGTSVSKSMRQKIYDAVGKGVGKDANGNPITAIQKYADENPVEFRKNIAYFFVMTDGFKNLDKVKEVVGSEVRKKEISALERTLNSTARGSDGKLKLVGGNNSSFGSGEGTWQIEL